MPKNEPLNSVSSCKRNSFKKRPFARRALGTTVILPPYKSKRLDIYLALLRAKNKPTREELSFFLGGVVGGLVILAVLALIILGV